MNRQLRLLCISVCLLCGVNASEAASTVLVTILEGKARLIRGASVYVLHEGVPVVQTDIIETDEHTHVQLEFADGSAVGVGPKSFVYLASVGAGTDRPNNIFLSSGWVKLSGPSATSRMRCSLAGLALQSKSGTFVVHRQDPASEVFVESGELLPSGSIAGTHQGALKVGDFAEIRGDSGINVMTRPSTTFLAALPRPFADSLPSRAAKFAGRAIDPALDRALNFEEADRWVSGYPAERKQLLHRFVGRLKDPVFRHKVEGNLARYPEWDRILHPEKYQPKEEKPKEAS